MIIGEYIQKFGNLSIKIKLFLAFLSLITLPLILFLFVNYFISARDNEKQALYSAHQVLNQTKSFLEFKTEAARNSLNYVVSDSKVQEIMDRKLGDYIDNVGLWPVDSLSLTKVFYTAKSNPDIYKIRYYMKHGPASLMQSEEIINLQEYVKSKWYDILVTEKNEVQWYGKSTFEQEDGTPCIYAVRRIISTQNINETEGAVRLDIPIKTIEAILNQAVFTKGSSALLVNSKNEIISSSSNSSINDIGSIKDILDSMSMLEQGQSIWKTLDYKNEKMLIGAHEVKRSDWKLLLFTPYKDILSLNDKSRKQMIYIFILIAPLTLPLAFFTAASATRRIKKLITNMRNVVNGDFNVSILPGNNDEIGELTRNFNYMLTRISMLIDEKYDLGKKMKNMELKALQAQINPHFLYNTLDMINWMSINQNVSQVSSVVEALAKFYKLSLSKGEDIVTIQNEIEHIEAYVQIQNMRFGDSICLEIQIPEHIRKLMILKLVFQPIVENAILHGILETDEEAGTIRITGTVEANAVLLYIEDNGVGMTEEKASTLLDESIHADEYHGYGVRNINERLKLSFGNDYGLSYKSTPGKGTVVTIKIPEIK